MPGQHLAHNWPLTWPPGPGLTLRTRKLLSTLPPLALALAALICDELNNIAGAGLGRGWGEVGAGRGWGGGRLSCCLKQSSQKTLTWQWTGKGKVTNSPQLLNTLCI